MVKLVTAIITTYKRPRRILQRAVDSILSQTYSNLELIVVDDSPESYEERREIKEYIDTIEDPRVSLIQHEKNKGACAARNTGIKASKGEFIAFLDDDDVWHEDKLEKQIAKMNSGDYGLVYCRQHIIDEVKNREYDLIGKYYEGKVFDKLIMLNFIGSTSFALIKRECFEKVGMFDISMPAAQDFEMWLRIAGEYNVGFVNEPLVDYYIHAGECISGSCEKKLIALEKLQKIHDDYLKSHKIQQGRRYLTIASYYAANRKISKAFKCYFAGVKDAPVSFAGKVKEGLRMIRAIFTKKV